MMEASIRYGLSCQPLPLLKRPPAWLHVDVGCCAPKTLDSRCQLPVPAGVGLESSDEDEAAARSPPAGPADAGPPQPQRTPDSGGRLKRRRDEPAPPANGGLEDADNDPGKPGWAHAVRCSSLPSGQLCLKEAQCVHVA